jgi:hypothetical protein
MSKKAFLEVVAIGASCLGPNEPSRHLLNMLSERLHMFKDDFPELIKLILVTTNNRIPWSETVTINVEWLGKFCSSLYDGLYMLELEACEYLPPEPPERGNRIDYGEPEPRLTTLTVGELVESLSKFDDSRPVHVVTYNVYSEHTSTETNHDITGVFGDAFEIQIQFED